MSYFFRFQSKLIYYSNSNFLQFKKNGLIFDTLYDQENIQKINEMFHIRNNIIEKHYGSLIKSNFKEFISYSYHTYCILSRFILIIFDIAPRNMLFVALILIFVLIKLYKKMFYKKFFFGHNMKNRVLYIECGGLLPHI